MNNRYSCIRTARRDDAAPDRRQRDRGRTGRIDRPVQIVRTGQRQIDLTRDIRQRRHQCGISDRRTVPRQVRRRGSELDQEGHRDCHGQVVERPRQPAARHEHHADDREHARQPERLRQVNHGGQRAGGEPAPRGLAIAVAEEQPHQHRRSSKRRQISAAHPHRPDRPRGIEDEDHGDPEASRRARAGATAPGRGTRCPRVHSASPASFNGTAPTPATRKPSALTTVSTGEKA